MPPQRLTPQLVRQLGQKGVRSEHRDLVVPGLVLRVGRSGAKSWAYCYSLRGRNYRITLGSVDRLDLAGARARAKLQARKVVDGRNPAHEERAARMQAAHTVGALVADMLGRVRLRPSTKREWERLARVELRPLARRPAADLSRWEVRQWLEPIAARSGWTANHAFELLRRAYSWGIQVDLVSSSPCAGVPKPYQGEASERVLSTPEVRALWRALAVLGEGQYPDAVRLLLLTGVRRAMVLGAKRGEFALELAGGDGAAWMDTRASRAARQAESRSRYRGPGNHGRPEPSERGASPGMEPVSNPAAVSSPQSTWTIPGGFTGRSKSGRAHVVPLSTQAAAVVRRRIAESPTEYLFPSFYQRRVDLPANPAMTIPSLWIRRLKASVIWQLRRELGPGKRAAMAPWHLHNLRHTLATHMTDALGVDENVVSLLLGHAVSGPRVSRVYNRAERLPERRAALNLWGAWVEGLAAERSNVLPISAGRGEPR